MQIVYVGRWGREREGKGGKVRGGASVRGHCWGHLGLSPTEVPLSNWVKHALQFHT